MDKCLRGEVGFVVLFFNLYAHIISSQIAGCTTTAGFWKSPPQISRNKLAESLKLLNYEQHLYSPPFAILSSMVWLWSSSVFSIL